MTRLRGALRLGDGARALSAAAPGLATRRTTVRRTGGFTTRAPARRRARRRRGTPRRGGRSRGTCRSWSRPATAPRRRRAGRARRRGVDRVVHRRGALDRASTPAQRGVDLVGRLADQHRGAPDAPSAPRPAARSRRPCRGRRRSAPPAAGSRRAPPPPRRRWSPSSRRSRRRRAASATSSIRCASGRNASSAARACARRRARQPRRQQRRQRVGLVVAADQPGQRRRVALGRAAGQPHARARRPVRPSRRLRSSGARDREAEPAARDAVADRDRERIVDVDDREVVRRLRREDARLGGGVARPCPGSDRGGRRVMFSSTATCGRKRVDGLELEAGRLDDADAARRRRRRPDRLGQRLAQVAARRRSGGRSRAGCRPPASWSSTCRWCR